jgi:hypothetical protein
LTFSPTALRITDELLFDRSRSVQERVTLAATLAYPDRNPSLTQLEERAASSRLSVIEAQNELERYEPIWTEEADGSFSLLSSRLVTYDRPSHYYDREPDNPRFKRPNRVVAIEPWADPDRARFVELPLDVVERLPRGHKNSALIRLLALFYAREQLRFGAIQKEDAFVARLLLGQAEKRYPDQYQRAIRRARDAMIEANVLSVADDTAEPAPIYTMPGATPGREPDLERFDPARTERLQEIELGGILFGDVLGSDAEAASARQLARQLGPAALLAISDDLRRDVPADQPYDLATILRALRRLSEQGYIETDFDTGQSKLVRTLRRSGTFETTFGNLVYYT